MSFCANVHDMERASTGPDPGAAALPLERGLALERLAAERLPLERKTGVAAAPAPLAVPETPFEVLDRLVHVAMSPITGGLSPAALTQAFFDWYVHLTVSPGKRLDLARQAIDAAVDGFTYGVRSALGLSAGPCARALPHMSDFVPRVGRTSRSMSMLTISWR